MFNLETVLQQILAEACAASGANFGTIFIYRAASDKLQLVVYQGLGPEAVPLFQDTSPDSSAISARAFRLGKRVLVADVRQDPFYIPYLARAAQVGYRAGQATPILDKRQRPIGVLAIGFAEPCHLTSAQIRILDRCAARAAVFIQKFWPYKILD